MKAERWTDPIVEEIRQWRDALARESGYDLKRLGALIMRSQKRHGNKLVQRTPKKLER